MTRCPITTCVHAAKPPSGGGPGSFHDDFVLSRVNVRIMSSLEVSCFMGAVVASMSPEFDATLSSSSSELMGPEEEVECKDVSSAFSRSTTGGDWVRSDIGVHRLGYILVYRDLESY